MRTKFGILISTRSKKRTEKKQTMSSDEMIFYSFAFSISTFIDYFFLERRVRPKRIFFRHQTCQKFLTQNAVLLKTFDGSFFVHWSASALERKPISSYDKWSDREREHH